MHLPFALFVRQSDIPSSTLTLNTTNPTATHSPFENTPTVSPTPVADGSTDSTLNSNVIIPLIVVILTLAALIILYMLLRRLRRLHENPKYIPTSYLKRKWSGWKPGYGSQRSTSGTAHLEPISIDTRQRNRSSHPPSSFPSGAVSRAENGAGNTTAGGVDRNTSVRSVMTLPAYNPKAGESETTIGREGERGGIDVVLEYPETSLQGEEFREQEMEALYQVRLARRSEAAEREERRRLRREARERNDFVALRELRESDRRARGEERDRTLEELRADHARIRDRQRAVSSVSYADLGVARHDGTRVRANSEESERPLLGDAASIAASSHHRRDRSASSVLSIDSDSASPGVSRRSRADSGATSQRRTSGVSRLSGSGVSVSGQMSSPEIIDPREAEGSEDFPPTSPPEYEHIALDDAQDRGEAPSEPPPDYQSPVDQHHPTFPSSRRAGDSGSGSGSEERDQLLTEPGQGADRRSRRGVGGAPQLPSLRLASLPSIVVNTPTPINQRRGGDEEQHPSERV